MTPEVAPAGHGLRRQDGQARGRDRAHEAPHEAAQRERQLAGVAAGGHQESPHQRQGNAEHLSPLGDAAHGDAHVGKDEQHAQALHDGRHGRARPVDGLQVRDLREEHGAQGHAQDAEHAAAVTHDAGELGAAVGRGGSGGQKEPAGGELAHAHEPERLHAVGVHEELRDSAVEAPERAAEQRADHAAAYAGAGGGIVGTRQGCPFYLQIINVPVGRSVGSSHGPPCFTRAASVARRRVGGAA